MTELRRSFINLLSVRHFSIRTIKAYESIVKQLACFHGRTPAGMNAEDIQAFLFYCVNVRKYSPASTNLYISALRTFYDLMEPDNRAMDRFKKLRPEHKIPHLLERSDLEAIFKAIPNIKYRAAVILLYSSGLRIGECCALKVNDIESGNRMMVRIEGGKGKKDRYTVLSVRALELLREYYKAYRPKEYLFPGTDGQPVNKSTITRALKMAAVSAGIKKPVYPHLLRHCFATHLLEKGVPLNEIQRLMGHTYISTTAGYAQVTDKMRASIRSPADDLENNKNNDDDDSLAVTHA
ncbi:MAG: site-specific integrase [Chitinispirillaceae bacterium]|nr:site-specific integrase [Chitinispirillaceae bacterium]